LQTEKLSNESEIQDAANKVFDFLELPEHKITDFTRKNITKSYNVNPEIRDRLIDFFKPYNEELEKLLNMKFNWE